MADNTLQTDAANIATDDIGGVHYQRVKNVFGPDGVALDVSSTNPLPVESRPAVRTVGTASGNIGVAYLTGTALQSAAALLVAAPAAGLSIYVTDMEGSNEGANNTRVSFLDGSTVRYARFMASVGGGFVTNLQTPWKLTAATALNYQVSVSTTWFLTVNYFIAP